MENEDQPEAGLNRHQDSERDMLVKKAETVKQASMEAQETLEKLKSDRKHKVLDSLTRLRNSGRVSGFHVSLIQNLPGRYSSY